MPGAPERQHRLRTWRARANPTRAISSLADVLLLQVKSGSGRRPKGRQASTLADPLRSNPFASVTDSLCALASTSARSCSALLPSSSVEAAASSAALPTAAAPRSAALPAASTPLSAAFPAAAPAARASSPADSAYCVQLFGGTSAASRRLGIDERAIRRFTNDERPLADGLLEDTARALRRLIVEATEAEGQILTALSTNANGP